LGITYLADTKNIPYGEKTTEELIERISNILDFFAQRQIKTVVAACNTVGAVLLSGVPELRRWPELAIFGVLGPAAQQAADFDTVGVLATTYTANSGVYEQLIHRQNPRCQVQTIGSPVFAALVEGNSNQEELRANLFPVLRRFALRPDAIVLGCTHYACLEALVLEFWAHDIKIINSGSALLPLLRQQLPTWVTGENHATFYVTGELPPFVAAASRFFAVDASTGTQIVL
jgi:glutamate racemase